MRTRSPAAVAVEFVARFRRLCPDVSLLLEQGQDPVARISPKHPEVGEICLWFDNDEVTVAIGSHYHLHIESRTYVPGGEIGYDPRYIERAVEWLHDFLQDRIILEICTVDGEYSGGSTCYVERFNPARCPSNARLFTWSGPWRPDSGAS